jgi:hypothetical protein
MNHKKTIEKYSGSMEELGEEIWDLDYDALAKHFDTLTKKFKKDSLHDNEIKHPQVAQYLANISKALKDMLDKEVHPLADLCRWYNEKGIR